MSGQIKHTSVGIKVSYVVLIGAIIVALVCAVLIGLTQANIMYSVAAQDDEATALEEKTVKKKVHEPTTKVVNLVSLIGKTPEEAVEAIGHGAKIESSVEVNEGKVATRATIVLTDEAGDKFVGTPTVVLDLNKSGAIIALSYSAGTAALGYGDFSFDEAVSEVFVIENTFRAAGLTSMELGSVQLPSKDSYSQYNTDGKTMSRESYTFSGVCPEGHKVYDWTATLTYDYTEANSTGNLANTIKTLTIGIATR